MQRQMTFSRYRAMDVGFFTVLLALCEAMIVLAATRWFPGEPYTLSLTPAVTAIVMVRWGAAAAFPAAVGSLAFCLFSGATTAQILIYLAGGMAALLLLPAVRRGGWQRLHGNVLLALLYGLLCALLMQSGRFLIALLLGTPPGVCAGFITTDVLSALFSVLLVWICRRLDGMLEEQKHYLIRIQKEMKEAGGINA